MDDQILITGAARGLGLAMTRQLLDRGCRISALVRAPSEGLEQLRRSEYVDAYYMAVFRSALGHRQQAFVELERACAENAAPLYAMNVDPKLDALRGDGRVATLFASLYKGSRVQVAGRSMSIQ